MKSISIIDYGVGNLLSVARAFDYFGANVKLIHTSEEVEQAERLILPGVGAFADGMKGLEQFQLVEAIQQFRDSGKPFLGICLGMQMMLTKSMEFGEHQGLDLIQGEVISIPATGVDGKKHKIPHIGWNELVPTALGGLWSDSILKDLPKSPAVYFVHSFMAVPSKPEARLADTLYNGQAISAVIRKDNLYGCQFHPEKSGEIGLNIIRQFLNT